MAADMISMQLSELASNLKVFSGFAAGYQDLRDGIEIPLLEDCLTSEAFAPILQETIVLELAGPGQIVYRLCGTRVEERIGMDMTGQNLVDFVPKDRREDLFKDISAMVSNCCGNYSRYRNSYSDGRHLEGENLSLPVRSEQTPRKIFLIALNSTGEIGKMDVRLQGYNKGQQTQIGAEWLRSVFVDVGFGVPGQTTFEAQLNSLARAANS